MKVKKVKSKKHNNVQYEYFWSVTEKNYILKLWIGIQGFQLSYRPRSKEDRDWYFSMLDNAFDNLIVHSRKKLGGSIIIRELEKQIAGLEELEFEYFKHLVENNGHLDRLEHSVLIMYNKWKLVIDSNTRLRRRNQDLQKECEYWKLLYKQLK